MKICVIGNSHATCLHHAWPSIEEMYPDTQITFFYNHGSYYDQFVVDEEHKMLTMPSDWIRGRFALSSGTDGVFDLKDYDICLVAGGFWHQKVHLVGQLGGQSKAGFSQQAITAALQDLYGTTHQSYLVPKIRQVSDIPVFLFQDPIAAHQKGMSGAELKHNYHPYDYKHGIKLLNELVMREFDAEYIEQPQETLTPENWTKYEFCVGERRPYPNEVAAGFKGDMMEDRSHMSSGFGAMRLAAFFKHIGVVGG